MRSMEGVDVAELERLVLAQMVGNGHALLSPSGASRWSVCYGSVTTIHQQRYTSPDNVASVEGTLAHLILETCLIHSIHPSIIDDVAYFDLTETVEWINRIVNHPFNSEEVVQYALECWKAINDCSFSEEMRIEVAKTYDIVQRYMAAGWQMHPELRVSLKDVLGHSQCDGTADIVLYKGDQLIIADLKYGIAIPVHPANNKQLMLYGLGVVIYLAKRGIVIKDVTLTISQSRINNNVWEQWSISATTLRARIVEDILPRSIKALYAIAHPEDVRAEWFVPTLSACQWCDRKGDCKPRMDKMLEDARAAFSDGDCLQEGSMIPKPFEATVSDAQLKALLKAEPFVTAWFKSAMKEGEKRTIAGAKDLGLKLVKGRMRRKFKGTHTEIVNNLIKVGVPLADTMVIKPVSPAQLEKKKLDDATRSKVANLVLTIEGTPNVVLDSDSREEYDPFAEAREIFK